MIQCKICGEYKDESEFYTVKTKLKSGGYSLTYRSECKKCWKMKYKQYYQDNKEEIRKNQKQYYQENKEHFLEYYQDNKEELLKYQKQYYQDKKIRK